ncbi:RusA family crossover junction endodeoxyribonuclease [Devosia sp. CN2-171]|uniref:RusA family crossover junction endodeoxyribonuclease n=1 Tax=Devosia sp. CN2-171 TaxID=3400909 RepID=UPI003BF91F28
MKVTLKGEPKSTNHIYKYACRGSFPCMYMSADGKALKKEYQWQVKTQFRGEPLKGPLSITVTIYLPTKRRSDWDNFHKLSMDALSGIVWEDDSQKQDARVLKSYDKENPRIEIEVRELA